MSEVAANLGYALRQFNHHTSTYGFAVSTFLDMVLWFSILFAIIRFVGLLTALLLAPAEYIRSSNTSATALSLVLASMLWVSANAVAEMLLLGSSSAGESDLAACYDASAFEKLSECAGLLTIDTVLLVAKHSSAVTYVSWCLVAY